VQRTGALPCLPIVLPCARTVAETVGNQCRWCLVKGSRSVLAGFVLSAALVGSAVSFPAATAQDSDQVFRSTLPMLASDGVVEPLPPADPSYCEVPPSSPPSPPNHDVVTGNLTIGGIPAGAGTIVQILFDGKAGPAIRTERAGVYRFEYGVGGPGCANHAGAAVSIRVAGQVFDTGGSVGDVFIRLDIAVP